MNNLKKKKNVTNNGKKQNEFHNLNNSKRICMPELSFCQAFHLK